MKIHDHRRPQAVPLRDVGFGPSHPFTTPSCQRPLMKVGNGSSWSVVYADTAAYPDHQVDCECGSNECLVHPVGGSEPAKVRFGDLKDRWFMWGGILLFDLMGEDDECLDLQAGSLVFPNDNELVTPIPSDQIEIHLGRKPNEGNAEYWEGVAKDFSRKLGEARARSNYEAIGRFACEELLDEDSHDLESMKWALQDLQKPTASGQEKIAVDSIDTLLNELAGKAVDGFRPDEWLAKRHDFADILRKHVVEATASSQPGPKITVDPRTDSATITTGHPWNAEQLAMVREATTKAKPQAVAEPSLAADREALVEALREWCPGPVEAIVAKHTIPAVDLAALREELAAARAALRAVSTMKDTEDWVKRFSGIYSFFAKYPDKEPASGQEGKP